MNVTSILCAAVVACSLTTGALAKDIAPFDDTSRVVSIGGSLSEIVYALGEEGLLVGRDSTSVYPEDIDVLPDVGYMRALSPEGVLSINPSALLVIEGSGPPEVLEVLEQSGVQYQTVPEGFSHEGILNKVRSVGIALGVDDKAKALAAKLDTELTAAVALTEDVTKPKRVLFVLSYRNGKIQASGTDSAAHSIIELSGAVNAVTEYKGYKALTEEALINANPDVILMMDRGGDHGALDDEIFANPAIALTNAGKERAIIRMDGSYLLNFGPRAASAIQDLATKLYPAQVK